MTFIQTIFHTLETRTGSTVAIGLTFLICVGALLVGKRILFARAQKAAAKSSMRWDDALVASLDFPLTILILAAGFGLVRTMVNLDEKSDHLLLLTLRGSVVLASVLFGFRLVDNLLKFYGNTEKGKVFLGGIARGLAKALIATLGALIFLQTIGVSITPILASLGIGSLAVALALQDTLSNLFAGIHLLMDKPLRMGDYVKLEGGQEGYVTEIGWRGTRLRVPAGNVVIVPNNKLTSAVLTNYYMPERPVAVIVRVGVAYGSDLDRVEKITRDVAQHILKTVPGGVPGFEPLVRFFGFGDSSIDFNVVLMAGEFMDQHLLKHEFIKQLYARYRAEKIAIPFPTRTVEMVTRP